VECRVVALAEAMPILGNRIGRNGRVAEARMMLEVGRPVMGNVVAGRIEPIVISLLSGCVEVGRGRRRRIIHRLRMRTPGERKRQWQQKRCENEKSFHNGTSILGFLLYRAADSVTASLHVNTGKLKGLLSTWILVASPFSN